MTGSKPSKELKEEPSRQKESLVQGQEVRKDTEYSRPKLLGQVGGRAVRDEVRQVGRGQATESLTRRVAK